MNVFIGQLLIFKERSCCHVGPVGLHQRSNARADAISKNTGLFLLACTFAFNAACLAVDGYRRLRKKLHKQQKSRHKDD